MCKTRVYLIFIFLLLLLQVGCVQNDSNGRGKPNTSTSGIAIPYAIVQAALPATGTLRALLYMDGGSTPIAYNMNVDTTATNVVLTADVGPGEHTFTIKFDYTDPTYSGPWDLATATRTLTIVQDVSNPLNFTAADYNYPDDDMDGLSNLAELDASLGTDPSDPTCLLDKSVIGDPSQDGCTLG